MNLDDPQLSGGGAESNVAPPTSGLDAFTAAVHQGLLHTSTVLFGDVLHDRFNDNDASVLDAKDYSLSGYARDGGFHDGITVGQAKVYAAKADAERAQKDAQAMQGHDWAARAGGLVGGAMDPLFYIPFIDELAPYLKVAEIAKRGEVLGTAATQSVNAMVAAAAETPLQAAYAKKHGEDFDVSDAATNVAFAGLAGGGFGGLSAKLNLMFPQKVAGIAKTLDDVNMGRQVDTGGIVDAAPDMTSQVQASLRAGVTPTDIDPATLDPRSQRAVAIAKQIDDGMLETKPAGWRPVTEDDTAFLDSYRADGGASYFKSKIDELEGRTEEGAEYRKRVDEMSPAEKDKELLTDHLTGIPNARAYAENERMPVQVRTDMDRFKDLNDTLGHDAGDEAIKKVAQIMHEEFQKVGGVAYRSSRAGDEFPAEAPTQAAADKAIAAARQRMESLKIEATGPDGTIYRKKGLGISYGSGNTTSAAEAGLLADKSARTQAGLRRSTGVNDLERVAPESAAGDQNQLGDRAGKLAYYREQLAAAQHPGVKWDPAGPAPPTPAAPKSAKAEPEEPDLTGLPLTDADKAALKAADEGASKLEAMGRALKAGAACFGLE